MAKSNTQTTEPTLADALAACTTTSAKIRLCASRGMKRGLIATTLNIRYQHVRNVLITPVKTPKA